MNDKEKKSFKSRSSERRVIIQVNGTIKRLSSADDISDGYHTFKELYDHRIILFIALCHRIKGYYSEGFVWKSRKHYDESQMKGWFIAGIGKDKGKQITYHLPMSNWGDLKVKELDKAPEWDGHTSEEVLKRIRKYLF